MRSGFPTRPALFGKTTWSPHGSDGGAGKNPHEGFGTGGTREAMKWICSSKETSGSSPSNANYLKGKTKKAAKGIEKLKKFYGKSEIDHAYIACPTTIAFDIGPGITAMPGGKTLET